MRTFETGATRDDADDKLEYRGFLSHRVLKRFAQYMHKHRVQPDGTLRTSDNWKRGMGLPVFMESMFRHFMDVYGLHEGEDVRDQRTGEPICMDEALCALLFNVQGYLHEVLGNVQKQQAKLEDDGQRHRRPARHRAKGV